MSYEVESSNEKDKSVKTAKLFDFEEFISKSRELPSGKPDTYGATPLDRMATLQQQLELAIELQQLTYRNIPDDIPMELVDYVHTTFATRFHGRAEANEENYMTALYTSNEYDGNQEVLAMFKRGELGIASPSELLMIRQLRGIRSVELACLTHPYGERIKDQLPEMRNSVKQHVELMGGIYFEEPEARYRVKELVGHARGTDKLEEGLLMTRKRTIGEMPDGTIIRERSSFVIRIDEASPFTKDEREAMAAVDLTNSDWKDLLLKAGKLDEVASVLLDMDEFSFAIPISSTIYAYNSEVARQIELRDAEVLARRRALFAQHSPEISNAMHSNLRTLKVAEDRGGIYYVGPSEYAKSSPLDFTDE